MKLASTTQAQVFLTGVTGFVGKVVLEELLRRFDEEELETIYVLIRQDRKGRSPQERFDLEVTASPCFANLPKNWTRRVRVVSGELSEPGCGIGDGDRHELVDRVTHLINCAASVEFDLPVKEAAAANITASLNVLEFARWCTHLKSMVNVSTAYVTPHQRDDHPITEELVPLKRPAQNIYHSIVDGTASEKSLLKEVGLPNTYTLTKCLSEHLLWERRGDVPLTIVRPSIVSASWRYPFRGWIDSKAAYAGFVALIGSGFCRAVAVQYPTLLDIVPCDEVANRIIDAAFEARRGDGTKPIIRHAVSGVANSCNIDTNISIIENYFRRHQVHRYPHIKYAGEKGFKFYWTASKYHHLPSKVLGAWYGIRGQTKKQRDVRRLHQSLNYLNSGFPYFTYNTFNFRSTVPLNDATFNKNEYIESVCRGVYRHLLSRDDQAILFAGGRHRKEKGDLRWVRGQPGGNWAIRLGAYIVRKGLRRCTQKITFDRPAFEAARAQTPQDSLMVIIPTHRSYMDFVLCSYLFFAYPDLKIAIPHIAAAEEFSRIPILGWLFKQAQAFYVKRGVGRENPEVTQQVHHLVDQKQTLEFFIEGTRSRSRKLLKPRRGMLRCLQATEQRCTVLPVTISYDRVPEEEAFLRELSGGEKPRMRLRPLLSWLGKMIKGKVDLGRIHITCGKPLALDSETDLHRLGNEVLSEFQKGMVVTTHHLRCFLKKNSQLDLSEDELIQAIEQRGGKVLRSSLGGENSVEPMAERCMRYQWMHLFYADARALYPNHPVLQHHMVENGACLTLERKPSPSELKPPKLRTLLRALFEPVCQDYVTTAQALKATSEGTVLPTPQQIVVGNSKSYLPNLEDAFSDLMERQILIQDQDSGAYQWGPKAEVLTDYELRCGWPREGVRIAEVG